MGAGYKGDKVTKPLSPLPKPLSPLTKPLPPLTKPLPQLTKPLPPLTKPSASPDIHAWQYQEEEEQASIIPQDILAWA